MEKESQHMNGKLVRIVITGPESTGKSTLSEQLATAFQTVWCPEFARNFLSSQQEKMPTSSEAPNGNYNYEDLLTIARGQIALENEMAENAIQHWSSQSRPLTRQPVLFIDTDMYVMKVWAEFVFGKCHPYILQQIQQRSYDFYLLCHTDLPWVKDELREYPDPTIRNNLFHLYKNILMNQSTPWSLVSGTSTERLASAENAIQHHFPYLFR
jgi:NadR type nicotinamide-nucleotide adenylyltransferase